MFGKLKKGKKKEQNTELVQVANDDLTPQQGQFASKFKISPIQKIIELPDVKDFTKLDVQYPLIDPYAYVHIKWDARNHELFYEVVEPHLNEQESKALEIVEKSISELINISFIAIKDQNVVLTYLEKNLQVLLQEFGINISEKTFMKFMYYLYRDFVGLNEIEPLMRDYYVEDVECNGVGPPVYIVHRKYRNIRTNISFDSANKLSSFVEKLAQKCGKYISYATPLLDGTLPDGSIDYDEPVIYRYNGIVKISKIGEVVDTFYRETESDKPIEVTNIEVPAFDKNSLKISWKKADYVYRHRVNGDIYEIKTEFGKKIRLTGCHSIFQLTKTGLKDERADKLKVGDYVAIPLRIPENDIIKEINLAEELSKTKYAGKFILNNIPENLYVLRKNEIYNFLRKN